MVSIRTAGDGLPSLFLISAVTGERRMANLSRGAIERRLQPRNIAGRAHAGVCALDQLQLSGRRLCCRFRATATIPAQEPIRLTDLHHIVDTLAWTVDGRELYFSAARSLAGARFLLFRVSANNRSLNSNVTDTGIEGVDPSVSPDGSALAYARLNIEQTSIPAAGRGACFGNGARDQAAGVVDAARLHGGSGARRQAADLQLGAYRQYRHLGVRHRRKQFETRDHVRLATTPRWSPGRAQGRVRIHARRAVGDLFDRYGDERGAAVDV